MKPLIRTIFAAAAAVLLAGTSFPGGQTSAAAQAAEDTSGNEAGTPIESRQMVGENEHFELWADPATADVFVVVKQTGKVWSTLPPQEFVDQCNEQIRKDVLSQLEIRFFDEKMQEYTYSSYADAVAKNQFSMTQSDNTVTITYQMGVVSSNLLVPQIMERSLFESYLEQMDSGDQALVKANYSLYTYEKALDSPGVVERITEMCPDFEHTDIYLLKDVKDALQKKLSAAFSTTDLTAQKIQEHYEELQYAQTDKEYPVFEMSLVFTLTEQGLNVRLPAESIRFDTEKYCLSTVSVLEQFGSTPAGESGYLLVPDGSGALIAFDTQAPAVFQKSVYGQDATYSRVEFDGFTQQTVLPVFGLKWGEDAFVAMITQDAALSTVVAATSTMGSGLNMVSPMFTVMANEFYRMENKMTFGLIRHSEVILGDDAEIDYVFLSGEEADYSGMAAAVQERFLAQADRLEEQTDIPLYLETYGSINKVERFFGFPVNVKKTLTTFEQAQEMLEEFRAGGVENLNLLYQGWFNGGMRYSTPTSISVQSELGGKNGYQELVDYTRANEIGFYPAVDFQYVQAERWLDHFQVSSDTARTLGGQSAKRFSYEIETLSTDRDSGKFIVRPVRLAGVAERFLQQNEQFGLKNLYVPALGSDLNSDFTDGQECILSEAQRYSEALLQSLGDSGYELMVDTGNLYAIPYVDHVVNLPSSSSRYLIEMEEIPFVQMIYHGYVSYAGEAINQGQNDEEAFLKAVENGGGLHYALFAADPSVVKETDYADMFSAYYPMWKDKALEQYSRANAALADLSGIRIIHHDILENGLRVVTYENGTRIVVNYSDEAVAYETIQVQPKDFCRITNGEAQ